VCLALCVSGALLLGAARAEAQAVERFEWTDPLGDPSHTLGVWTYAPVGIEADAPVVFVVHGVRRNAREYLETWRPLADRYRVVVVAPEFAARRYPGKTRFATGYVVDRRGRPVQSGWDSFTMVDHLFDAVRDRLHNTTRRYYMFGHSAGGQFVHRFVLQRPDRVEMAVAANPGWYPNLTWDLNYPRGLRNSGVDESRLGRALSVPLLVLLGQKDNAAASVRVGVKTGRMVRDGNTTPVTWRMSSPHGRARRFYEQAERLARDFKLPLRWTLQVVPHVGHKRDPMASMAAAHMFGDRVAR